VAFPTREDGLVRYGHFVSINLLHSVSGSQLRFVVARL
jgi:hypothetical protein